MSKFEGSRAAKLSAEYLELVRATTSGYKRETASSAMACDNRRTAVGSTSSFQLRSTTLKDAHHNTPLRLQNSKVAAAAEYEATAGPPHHGGVVSVPHLNWQMIGGMSPSHP